MRPTFIPELSPYENKEGTRGIYIRITVNRKPKRVPVGYAVPGEHWNQQKREVRKTYPEADRVNRLIELKVTELKQIYLDDAAARRPVSARSLQQKAIAGDSGGNLSFIQYAKDRISRLPSAATRESQTSVIAKLETFLKGKDLQFSEVTPEFLADYRNYLSKTLGNSSNTIHSNFQKLKAAYNLAVLTGAYKPYGVSPFAVVKVKKLRSQRRKLKAPEIALIENYQARPGTMAFHSVNAFLFAFYLQGMRVSDLLQLTWKKVSGSRLQYEASKTGKGRSRLIPAQALKILEYYRQANPNARPRDYIFPFLEGRVRKEYTEHDWLKLIKSATSLIRNHLVQVGQELGIGKISMHVARHSFATIARKKSGDIYAVSDALDHGDVKTTEGYTDGIDDEENDELVEAVFGRLEAYREA